VVLPEIVRERRHAGVEQIDVVEDLVVGVVLGRQAEHRGLDAQVDVLRDDDDRVPVASILQALCGRQDLVVGAGAGQRRIEVARQRLGLEEQAPDRRLGEAGTEGRRRLDRQTRVDLGLVRVLIRCRGSG
jgi:hypothetical protein